ncbi:MAG: hypothetical protein Q9198_003900 [Flavoplaca austrocitrina]
MYPFQAAPIFREPISATPLPPHKDDTSQRPTQRQFYPYTDNGGITLGISGSDFALLAGDTRSTNGYSINTRFDPKVFPLGTPDHDTTRLVLSTVGFAADGKALKERLDTTCNMYAYRHGKPITLEACAHRLSTLLYEKRFFPYQVQAMLAGIDADGKGALYSYDPAGSYKRDRVRAVGPAASLMMPFLDNQVSFNNQYQPKSEDDGAGEQVARPMEDFSRDEVMMLVKDAFHGVTERHIEVGDELQVVIITKDGVEETFVPLKRD